MTSGFDQLERELRRAEARLGSGRVHRYARSPLRLANGAMAAASVLVAIVIAVVALLAFHSAKPSTGPTGTAGAPQHYADPAGWSIAFARGLHLTVTKSTESFQRGQVTVTSFPVSRFLKGQLRNGTQIEPGQLPFNAPLDAHNRFPTDGVAVMLQLGQFTVLGADSRFPIALDSFQARSTSAFFSRAAEQRAGLPAARSRLIVAYGESLTATILIGNKASAALTRELAGAIGSLRFRALRPGTQVGPGVVLGPATAYPVGSFVRTDVRLPNGRRQPIYVVHAPGRLTTGHDCGLGGPCVPAGSFYGIGGSYNTRRNHAPLCAIRLDHRNRVFSCANLGVRWDRVGRVISRPANESYIGSIEGLYVKISWNGQLMITPGFGPQLSRAAVHDLWPSWHQPNEPLSR